MKDTENGFMEISEVNQAYFCLVSDYYEVEKEKKKMIREGKFQLVTEQTFLIIWLMIYIFKFFISRNFHEEDGISD